MSQVDMFAAVRLRAVKERDYFALALFALHMVPRPGLNTMAIDQYGRVYVDPDIIGPGKRWTVEQAAWVLIHELGHWLRKHFERAKPIIDGADCTICEAQQLNIAEDMEINDDLASEGAHLPDDAGVQPRKYGFPPGKLFEEYHMMLKQKQHQHPPAAGGAQQQQGGQGGSGQSRKGRGQGSAGQQAQQPSSGSGKSQQPSQDGVGGNRVCDKHKVTVHLCGSAAHGLPQPYEEPAPDQKSGMGIGDAEGDLLRKRVAQDIVAAANRQPGSVPAGWKRWAETLLAPPQIPWEKELAALVRNAITMAAGCIDYSYTKPCRRGSFNGVIMPALRRPKPEATVVVDTSGSMGEGDLQAALVEIAGILKAVGQQVVPVICCDAAAAPVQRISRATSLEIVGGGGTDMGEGIAAAEKIRSEVIIVLTDAWTPWPAEPPRRAQLVVGVIGREGESTEQVMKDVPSYVKRVLRIFSDQKRDAA